MGINNSGIGFNIYIPIIINLVLIIASLGVGITIFVLIVKLALRGIKALDIYISMNRDRL
jgi:general stress protein CsbA